MEKIKKSKIVLAYSDGSCLALKETNKDNPLVEHGGIGVYLEYWLDNKLITTKKISRGYKNTTITRMEGRAMITAMKSITDKQIPVIFISDSQCIINSFNEGWLFNWQKQGFDTRTNPDLWKSLFNEFSAFKSKNIQFIHIRGHGKETRPDRQVFVDGNKIADQLADYKQFDEYFDDIY